LGTRGAGTAPLGPPWRRRGQRGTGAAPPAQPIRRPFDAILEDVVTLEICNWRLEESVAALCRAIGAREPCAMPIGHMSSMTGERWQQFWALYLALQAWLAEGRPHGLPTMLRACDPDGVTFRRVASMLGGRNELKELYVERTCLCLESWLRFLLIAPGDGPERTAHRAAVDAIEQEIQKRDPAGRILNAFKEFGHEGDGRLQPCHHKALRRYDVIISSIGAGAWRGAMPMRGTDGLERADTLDALLAPIRAWLDEGPAPGSHAGQGFGELRQSLGKPDGPKCFLAALPVSLLHCQALSARQKAQSRAK
jgi:hypothetical protein